MYISHIRIMGMLQRDLPTSMGLKSVFLEVADI